MQHHLYIIYLDVSVASYWSWHRMAFFGTGRFSRLEDEVMQESDSPRCCQRIASNRWFERVALLLTLSNVIYISVDVEFNYSGLVTRASPGFIAAENLFCSLFLTELVIRFFAYPHRMMAVRDTAFLFHMILVAMMMLECWVMPLIDLMTAGASSDVAETSSILRIARVMRILRTARIAKLIRYMPELVILLKGMLSACRSVFFTLLLLLLVTYVFSITITEVSRGTSLEEELLLGARHISFTTTCVNMLELIWYVYLDPQELYTPKIP